MAKQAITAGACASCLVLTINGVRCHEAGCRRASIGKRAECKWCGGEFRAKRTGQRFCGRSCERSHNS